MPARQHEVLNHTLTDEILLLPCTSLENLPQPGNAVSDDFKISKNLLAAETQTG